MIRNTTSPEWPSATRDALAEKLYVNAMASAVGLGEMDPEKMELLCEQVADITLTMANCFLNRARNTPISY